MTIKRFTASIDTTITNAYKENLSTRGTGSSMGASDILEIFSIYGQQSGTAGYSQELSRALIEFPINVVSASRAAGDIPVSGNVSFYLKLYNASHSRTMPSDYILTVSPISRSWTEGIGLDMEGYSDSDYANWLSASSTQRWSTPGGDYHTGTYTAGATLPSYDVHFPSGDEDLDVSVTHLVEEWLAGYAGLPAGGARDHYGVGIHLTASQEAYFSNSSGIHLTGTVSGEDTGRLHKLDGATTSYYTKMFFGRGSEYFFKRPALEARWDSAIKDDRGNAYISSSLATSKDNLNTLYLYNYVKGQLQNIPDVDQGLVYVSLFSGNINNSAPSGNALALYTDGTHVTSKIDSVITGG